jgi:NhaP-type Na+/H+ or K+/H+ antiporter
MDSSIQLILICGVVIIAYLIEIVARRAKVPAVLFLIIMGIILRQLSDHFSLISFDFKQIIPALGTFGLILIVFEGALDLDYQKQKNKIIRNAFLASLIILLATTVAITFFLMRISGETVQRCLANAIPLSIISSAIAIPSVVQMTRKTREFITYESTFSDILGIILFNYAISYSSINMELFLRLGGEIVFVTIMSFSICLILLFLLKSINHSVKFILIITVMVFMFALGKYFHLSSLILVLIFGLFLKNLHLIKLPAFQKYFTYSHFEKDFGLLHQITAEGVFLVKTFFFVIFGFIIDFNELLDNRLVLNSLLIIVIIYLVRAPLIRIITGKFLPETFISPRGLITILLYLSLPEEFRIPEVSSGILFIVVLISSLMMLMGRGKRPSSAEKEASNDYPAPE